MKYKIFYLPEFKTVAKFKKNIINSWIILFLFNKSIFINMKSLRPKLIILREKQNVLIYKVLNVISVI